MSRLIRIELLKIRTTRLSYGLLATATGLTALLTVLRAATAGTGKAAPLYTATGLTRTLTVSGFALLIAIVFGATVSSGEFRHNTATSTYLATPNRAQVLVAKLIAAAGVGLLFGAGAFAAGTAVALTFVAAHGYHVTLSASTIIGYGAGAILAGCLLAAFGVALGTLVRGQLGVVIGVLVWGFFVESILGGVFNQIGAYLPFTAATTLAGAKLGGGGFGFAGSSSATPLPFIAAVALIAALAGLISTIASHTTLRADIT
jgi:ABC-type transport system involved in multi-copper enzyme maturation permease subunit